ncbi:unnamed protein product, partial [Polarella glacialis]
CPAVLYSKGFASLTGVTADEVIGKDLFAVLLDSELSRDPQVQNAYEAFCLAAQEGRYFPGNGAPGVSLLPESSSFESGRLAEGELTFRLSSANQVYMKQVELDDGMFVMCLKGDVPQSSALSQEEDGHIIRSFCEMNKNLETAIQIMAADFFFSAPMRRQAATGSR